MKFDMHCHTAEGSLDGKVKIEEYIRILRHNGFDGMLVTDHNSYNGYRFWQRYMKGRRFRDFVVLRGIEYDTIDAGHILVIMPEKVFLPILEFRGLPVLLLIHIVHKNGGILGPAHPCGERYLSITNTGRHRHCLSVMEQFDFVETFIACESAESNKRARNLAKQFRKPTFGGSDSHKPDCVGLAFTQFSEEIRSESDLIALLRDRGRRACISGGSFYEGTTKQKIGRANDLLVQSFWFYNRVGSLLRRHKRMRELKKIREKH